MLTTATTSVSAMAVESARAAYIRLCAAGVSRLLQLRDLPHAAAAAFRPEPRRRSPARWPGCRRLHLTGVVLKLPAGAWSDVFGRRPLLVAGALVFRRDAVCVSRRVDVAALIVVRALHGSATAIFGPVASARISDLAPPTRRGAWLSTYSTIQGAGQAVGPIVAGYLIAGGRFDVVFVVSGSYRPRRAVHRWCRDWRDARCERGTVRVMR